MTKERKENFDNPYYEIDDLPLTTEQKKCVLEWLAWKYYRIMIDAIDCDDHHKHYDPLMIVEKSALSYVFNFEDGGRLHPFKNLKHLEDMLDKEIINKIINEIRNSRN